MKIEKEISTSLICSFEDTKEFANKYAAYIMKQVKEAKHSYDDPIVLIEARVDFPKYLKLRFGVVDCVIIADGNLHIIKICYLVDTPIHDNQQMKLYALGALDLFDGIYDINAVTMTIYQPIQDKAHTHTVFKESIYNWAEETFKELSKGE